MVIERNLPFDTNEFRSRLDRIQDAMQRHGLDGLVLFSPQNVYYVSGMDTETMYGTEAVLVPRTGDPTLVVHRFERGRADSTCWLSSVRDYEPMTYFVDAVIEGMRELGFGVGVLGIEQHTDIPLAPPVSPRAFEQIRSAFPHAILRDTYGTIDDIRMRKSAAEIGYMQRAAALTEIGVAAGFRAIHDGARDNEVAAEICHAIYLAGSDLMCWGPIVAAGYRSGAPHSTFGGQTIHRGDTVLLELTGQVRHYVGPALRAACVGRPTPEIELISQVSQEAVGAILSAAGPGVPACDVARAGKSILSRLPEGLVFHGNFGYPVGIGFPPTWGEYRGYLIEPDNDRPLASGMTFHLTISLRQYGVFGVCHSQTLLITETGAETLTAFPAPLYVAP